MSHNIIALLGPTATGKTQLALKLAAEYPLEIISVDSAMIYKGMDIGTGKPTPLELQQTPHHLIDILDPLEKYSAADFCRDAKPIIQAIQARGNIPFLVGGTMLYFNAFLYGMHELPSADLQIRLQLENEKHQHGLEKLYQELCQIDPESAKRIHAHDTQRILRALEVFRCTGRSISDLRENVKEETDFDVTAFAIVTEDRSALHRAIAERFQQMLHHGFVEEVEQLRKRGDLSLELPSMRAVGYRQIWQYLEGEFDFTTLCEKAIAATRQLAKRQLTWLRHWKNIHVSLSAAEAAVKIRKSFS